MKKLLAKDPKKRLGANGAQEIKEHPWFQKFNFQWLYEKKMKAPYTPVLKSKTDTRNFDE